MIIRSFSIDRFGIFAGQHVPELSPGLNIFLGDNEAGKSTLLNFFRAMFFGYKRGNKNSKLDYGTDGAASGLSGGSLALQSKQGTPFNLIRRPGKHGGELTLSEQGGRALPESFLAEILSGYTDKMYDQVFCFGYDDLASLSGMKAPEVADVLHAATFGTGFRSPLEVAKILEARQSNIYTARKFSTPVYKHFKRLEEIKSELSRLGSEFNLYNALMDDQEALGKEEAALKAGAIALELELARAHSLLAAWQDWEALGEIRAALVQNPHPGGEFAVESMAYFDERVAELDASRADCKRKQALLESERAALSAASEFAALDAVWADAQSLQSRRLSVQKAIAGIPAQEAALEAARDYCSGRLQGLGGWSLEKVLNFELALPLQEGVELGRQSLDSAARQLENAENEAQRLEGEARDAREEAMAVRHSFGQGGHFDLSPHLYSAESRMRLESTGLALNLALQAENEAYGRISNFEEEAAALHEEIESLGAGLTEAREDAERAAAEAKAALAPPLFSLSTARQDTRRVKWLLLCLALALLCFSGTYKYFATTVMGQDSLQKLGDPEAWKLYLSGNWLTFGLGLVFIWGAFYWLAPRSATLGRWRPKEPVGKMVSPEEREATSRADALAGQVQAQGAQLARITSLLEKSRTAAQAAAQSVREALADWKAQTAAYGLNENCRVEQALRIFDAALAAAQCDKKARVALEALESARRRLENAETGWVDWLEQQGFDPSFTPETVRLALQRIQQVQEHYMIVESRRAELESSRKEVESFRLALEELLERSGFAPQADELLSRFDALHSATVTAHEEMLRLAERERELEKTAADLVSANELLRNQEKRLTDIISQGEAESEADYRLRFKAYTAHMELRSAEDRLVSHLERAALQLHVNGEALWAGSDEFLRALGESGREAVQEREAALKAELADLGAALAKSQKKQGENNAQLKSLESGKGSAALQAEEAAIKDDLKALSRNWGVMAMARNFISQARRNFEEERHDSVIRQAGEILGQLTGGRYGQMLFDLSASKAYAVSRSGESLDSESVLSQGTREQLYLALRLAFIRQHNLSKESLPLIMDDILVNFDPGRSKNAAEIFAAFSADNQGMFFTCHPHTAKLLASLSKDAASFSIKNGQISRVD